MANDLLDPVLYAGGALDACMTLVAVGLVVVVARKTRSLIWCAVVGMAAYALLVIAL